jgi:hypothetical protein
VLIDVRVDQWQTPELQLRKRLDALHAKLGRARTRLAPHDGQVFIVGLARRRDCA